MTRWLLILSLMFGPAFPVLALFCPLQAHAVVVGVDLVRAMRPHEAHVVRQLVHLLQALREQHLAAAGREARPWGGEM